MFYYKFNNSYIMSKFEITDKELYAVEEEDVKSSSSSVYIVNKLNPKHNRRVFKISHPSQAFLESEGLNLLNESTYENNKEIPNWLEEKIKGKKVFNINIEYDNWKDVIKYNKPSKWKINLVGLGDVGGTLLSGLKLLGYNEISEIGIFDLDKNKVSRWHHEISQILSPSFQEASIDIVPIDESQLFQCDMFIFCVSVGVPKVGNEQKDVRMVQFEGNTKVINYYAKKARENNFKGIFAVVSDPVDLLCKSAFISSNTDDKGNLDFKGLCPDQIAGFGLGVMNGRAAFYSKKNEKTANYMEEGRAFGPHGEGLIIANSIDNYDNDLSTELTELTKTANLKVRESGFKPYIAPALSSGSLSLLSFIKGEWHYSSNFIGGTFFGCKNRRIGMAPELETYKLDEELYSKLQNTYKYLSDII